MSLEITATKAQQRQTEALIRNVDHYAEISGEGRHASITDARTVRIVPVRMQYNPFIPCDVLTLIAGRAGETKSTLSIKITAGASTGTLPGDMTGRPITVALTAFEDPKSMQVARLTAAGADLSHVKFIDMVDTCQGQDMDTGMSIPGDLAPIEKMLMEQHIGMWVIDPITSAMSGDTNKRDDVRHALDPLAAMAQRLHIPVLLILHFNKGGGYASDKISGSHAWRDAAKSVLLVAKDDENGEVVLTIDKTNYTQAMGSSWTYSVTSADVRSSDGKVVSVPVIGDLKPTDKTVGEIINRQTAMDQDDQRQDPGEVIDWLTDYLRDGSAPFKQIMDDARDEGYSKYQIQHAQQRATNPAIESVPDPTYTGRGQRRVWRLSNTSQPTPHSQMASNGYKSETQAAVGQSISSQLLATRNKTCPASNTPASAGTGPRPLDLARFDSNQFDGLAGSWSKKLQRDGIHSMDHELARMTPESLEMLNRKGGMLKTATDAEYERRSNLMTSVA